MTRPRKYDLALFIELNEEYESKRIHKNAPPITDAPKRIEYKRLLAQTIARNLAKFIDLKEKSILDFGCGRGDMAYALSEEFNASLTGVDIFDYPEWKENQNPKVKLRLLDLCEEENAKQLENQIDVVVSNSVLEHVIHPYKALQGLKTVLKPNGYASLKANLYRGPLASHRYRDVYFPWPHLLFSDDVFAQYYQHLGKAPNGAAWVNKLTHLHYKDYFQRLGFEVLTETYNKTALDEDFYARFEDILSRYPRSDLEKNFINVILKPK